MGMVHNSSDTHAFAVYVPTLSGLLESAGTHHSITIAEPELVHRISVVLRAESGDGYIFFDQSMHAYVRITDIVKKKRIVVAVEKYEPNKVPSRAIHMLLPVLKRDALETAFYSLTEMGASTIQLVITQKSQHLLSAKELERAQRIIIAAAEQSKNYAFPLLFPPLSLEKVIVKHEKATKLFCDPAGIPLLRALESVDASAITVLIGPEGDLTEQEKQMLIQHGVVFCALTPTVLRACQAAGFVVGFIRTVLG